MKKHKKGILLIAVMCSLLFAATCASASAAIFSEQPLDADNPVITIEQGYSYGTGEGHTLKITSEDLTEGVLVMDGETYELNTEYKPVIWLEAYNNYDQLDPYDYFLIGETKYSFHVLSEWTPPSYEPEPPLGEWMSYGYKVELTPAKMPVDVVFTGEKTISCYVGDSLMSNQGITVDDNGEDLTYLLRGEKVDTSKASKVTYTWYVAGRNGNMVTFVRTFIIQAKQTPAQQEETVTPAPTTTKPAAAPKAKQIKTTAIVKGSGSIKISGPGKCHKNKKKLWITTDKGKKVTLKAKGKKFKYWQKKVGKKYKKYSKKKTIKVKASKNTTYRAVFKK